MTNKTLFLDRDGVINLDHGYLYQPEKFEFIPGVFEACRLFQDAGYQIVVVTNQSGIGRGYYTEDDFHHLTSWMVEQFENNGITILDVYFCPHHPKKANAPYLKQCDCRKPEPGMLLQAISEHDIAPEQSIMVGDKVGDVKAGISAGIQRQYLVTSGQSLSEQEKAIATGVFSDLLAVANHVLG